MARTRPRWGEPVPLDVLLARSAAESLDTLRLLACGQLRTPPPRPASRSRPVAGAALAVLAVLAVAALYVLAVRGIAAAPVATGPPTGG